MPDSKLRHLPWLLVVGCVLAGIANLITTRLAPDTSLIADTISDAAAGPYDWIQDLGFAVLALGFIAQSWLMWLKAGSWKSWTICALAMTTMSISLLLIAYVHEYGDGDEQGAIVHYWAVYAHGIAYLALLFFSIPRLRQAHSGWLPLNITIAILFFVGSAYFFNMNTRWDGLVERGLALLLGGWLIIFAARTAWQLGSRPFPKWMLPDLVTSPAKH